MPNNDQFICALCKTPQQRKRTDEELIIEFEETHGFDFRREEVLLICHECWIKVDLDNNPQMAEELAKLTLKTRAEKSFQLNIL